MIKRLNPKHLERLLNNECDIKLYQEGLSEEGEPLTSLDLKNQKCRFIEKTKIIITADGKKVEHIYVSVKRNDAKEQSIATQNTLLKMIEKDGDVDPTTISDYLAT